MYINPEWRCVEDNPIDKQNLHYSRFVLSPLVVGQGMILGVAMRTALLSQVEGITISSVKILGAIHEYSTLEGLKESVYEILMNFKQIILKGKPKKLETGRISVQGPGIVTAEHIKLPSSITIVDPDQYIATLTKDVTLNIDLLIHQKAHSLETFEINNLDRFFQLDTKVSPIKKVNYSIYSFGKRETKQEILFLEIWTNRSLTPKEALSKAYNNILQLFNSTVPSQSSKDLGNQKKANQNKKKYTDFAGLEKSNNFLNSSVKSFLESNYKEEKKKIENLSIDKLELSPKISNSLRRENIHTVSDLFKYSEDDLLKMKNLGKKSVEQVLLALKKNFNFD